MDLILERRGMDFYDGCPEKKEATDFDNFRLFGEIFSYWIKLLPLEEAIERTIHPKGRAKYFRDGLTLFEWCRQNHKNYYNEYKKVCSK